MLVPDIQQPGHVRLYPRQCFPDLILITVRYRLGGCWHKRKATPCPGRRGSLTPMTDTPDTAAAQDGAAPPDLPGLPGETIAPAERIMGAVGMAFGVIILILGFDLLTGIPSRVLAQLTGGDDSADA